MTALVDRALHRTKWLVAVIALLLLPGAVQALVGVVLAISAAPEVSLPFLLGLAGYVLAWRLWFRHRAWGSMLSTLEHELTHALFGLLTFRLIRGIKVTWSRGGHVTFPGPVNWVILLAPYWFPTISVCLVCLMGLVSPQHAQEVNFGLGVSVGYHLTSTWRETHPGQSDLRRVGLVFCCCVLPLLNVLTYGGLLAFVVQGNVGAMAHISEVFSHSLVLFGELAEALG